MTVATATPTPTKTGKPKARVISDAVRLRELKNFMDICFTLIVDREGDSNKRIAELCGLSYWTIWRMRSGEFSLKIRYDTVQRVATVAGLRLTSTEYGFQVRLVD